MKFVEGSFVPSMLSNVNLLVECFARRVPAPRFLIIDEMGYLLLDEMGATIFFQLVSARYERGSIILSSNKSYGDWGSIFWRSDHCNRHFGSPPSPLHNDQYPWRELSTKGSPPRRSVATIGARDRFDPAVWRVIGLRSAKTRRLPAALGSAPVDDTADRTRKNRWAEVE